MSVGVNGYSPEALSRSTRLVRAYADSLDGNVATEVEAVLGEVGRDESELTNLVASLAGLAGHAVRVIAVQLEADLGLDPHPGTPLPRLGDNRAKVLVECADAVRAWAEKRERRSGLDRRLASERRQLAPDNPSEQVNLRLFGERRLRSADRRSGIDRRAPFGTPERASVRAMAGASEIEGALASDRRRIGAFTRTGLPSRPRP